MSVFKANCPHCGTRSVAFSVVYEHRAHMYEHRTHTTTTNLWDTLAFCAQCSRSILATFLLEDRNKPREFVATHDDVDPLEIYPSPRRTGAPEHTPTTVAEYYRQGIENLPGNWTAAGIMFRKTLDIGLKAKFPSLKGTLEKRIDKAAEQGGLTSDLAEWAHQVRLDGNDAAHEEEPSEEEVAKRLHAFTRLVLLYLFTLPEMLRKARVQAEEETGASPDRSSGLLPTSGFGK